MLLLIADDHAGIAARMAELIREQFPTSHYCYVAGGNEALEQVYKAEWDLVILDIHMPGRSGINVLKHIRSRNDALPVIITSFSSGDQYEAAALCSGATAFIPKHKLSEHLVNVVKRIMKA